MVEGEGEGHSVRGTDLFHHLFILFHHVIYGILWHLNLFNCDLHSFYEFLCLNSIDLKYVFYIYLSIYLLSAPHEKPRKFSPIAAELLHLAKFSCVCSTFTGRPGSAHFSTKLVSDHGKLSNYSYTKYHKEKPNSRPACSACSDQQPRLSYA